MILAYDGILGSLLKIIFNVKRSYSEYVKKKKQVVKIYTTLFLNIKRLALNIHHNVISDCLLVTDE